MQNKSAAKKKLCNGAKQRGQINPSRDRTYSMLQTTVPSGRSPTGFTLPMDKVAFLPQKTNCTQAHTNHPLLIIFTIN